MTAPNAERLDHFFLSDLNLARRWNVHRSYPWRLVQRGELAPPIRLGPGVTRWRLADIEAFEAEAAKRRDAERRRWGGSDHDGPEAHDDPPPPQAA